VQIIEEIGEDRVNPLDTIQDHDVLEWCELAPQARYPIIARVGTIFRRVDEKAPLQWTELALCVLERAPNRIAVLKQFVRRFSPSSWSGSRAAIIEERAQLLRQFEQYPDAAVGEFIANEQRHLEEGIERERQWENQQDKARHERFE
jgi:hypothetical protein